MRNGTLCGDGCVRCGACFGEAGEACDAAAGSMLDEESLAVEVAEVLERRGFPPYAARQAAEAAVVSAIEAWRPCRADGSLDSE